MTRVLATYNIKGGVGKTSAAVNLAWLAAREGQRTLLWDLDPQAAATYLLRVRPKLRGGARELVALKSPVAGLVRESDHVGLDLLPADMSLRHLDLALDRRRRPTRRLGRIVEPLLAEYDLIMLDCPPSLSLVSEGVFELADALLVPVIPAALPVRAFAQLRARVEDRSAVLAFGSMVDAGRPLHRLLMAQLRAEHPRQVLGASIPLDLDVERMGTERTVVEELAPGSRATSAYRALWWDVRGRLAGR